MQETPCKARDLGLINPWVQKTSWSRKWQPIPVFLPGKSDGQRSLMGYHQWGHKESDTTEQLSINLLLNIISDLFPLSLK